MKFGLKIVLWAMVLVFLGLSAGSFFIRWNNERANRTIVNIIGYREFYQTVSQANMDMTDVLTRLHEAGANAVAMREMTMQDMAQQGRIKLQPFGEFIGELRVTNPEFFEAVQDATAPAASIGWENLVAIAPAGETADFMYERLEARFISEAFWANGTGDEPEFFHLAYGGNEFFIMNAELMGFHTGIFRLKDVHLGFDVPLMEEIYGMGFSIVLRPSERRGSMDGFWAEYEELIQRFNIRTIIFATRVFDGGPEDSRAFAEIVQRNNMIVGIVETSQQIGYINQPRLPMLMGYLDFQVNRAYSTTFDDFVGNPQGRYHRWVRSIIDRNLRLIHIAPFNDAGNDISTNVNNTINIVEQFTQTMTARGYSFAREVAPLDTSQPTQANRIFIGLSLVAAGVLYLAYLLNLKNLHTAVIFILGALAVVAINLTGLDWSLYYALGSSILYPSLATLLILLYLKKFKQQSAFIKMLVCLAIFLGVNALGMYTAAATLADIRYIMNVLSYRGVQISLFVPLLVFAVNYLVVFTSEDGIIPMAAKFLMKSPSYLVLGLGAGGLLFALMHISRSGNDPIIAATQLELQFRGFLEGIFVARPRFREFAFGYPALAVMVYLYHKYKHSLILFGLGFLVVLGSTSVINSFNHVFTSVYISMHRTFAGLVLGVFVAAGVLVGVVILEKISWNIWNRYKGE